MALKTRELSCHLVRAHFSRLNCSCPIDLAPRLTCDCHLSPHEYNHELVPVDYNTMYMIEPGQKQLVEANPDPTGLKVGIVYAVDVAKQEMLYHRFLCKNDGTLNITEVRGDDISYYGNRGMFRLMKVFNLDYFLGR